MMDENELRATIQSFCRQWFTACLCTVDETGKPHGANVQVAIDDELNLYFVSSPDSAHSEHVTRASDAAMTIYAHTVAPPQIHGVQMHGQCETATDHDAALAAYLHQFPFIADDDALRARVEAEQLYCFKPRWLRWIDNRVRFGFKQEMCVQPKI